KRNARSSGNSQAASTGSGGSNSRIGRGGFRGERRPSPRPPPPATGGRGGEKVPLSRTAGEGPERSEGGEGNSAGTRIEALSGIWLSWASSRDSAASPSRLPSRSRSGAMPPPVLAPTGEPANAICSGGRG